MSLVAPEELERQLAADFQIDRWSPEEYAARHAADILCFSLDDRRYRDPALDRFIQRLGEILSDWNLVNDCRRKYLTPEEMQRALERDQEEPCNRVRRFEMNEGGSSKFWEVDVRGAELIVRFGRLGTAGQRKAKQLAGADAARREAEKLVREKLAKGYVEIDDASVAELWERLEAWFAKRHPDLRLQLRPGAGEAEIAAAERALGQPFPPDFRASLAIHDGQEASCNFAWLPIACQLRSLDSLVRNWTEDRRNYQESAELFAALDKSKRVRQCHLHPRQIPFAALPHWDYGRLLFDFTPGPAGTPGQIIARDDIHLVFIAPRFRDLLAVGSHEVELLE